MSKGGIPFRWYFFDPWVALHCSSFLLEAEAKYEAGEARGVLWGDWVLIGGYQGLKKSNQTPLRTQLLHTGSPPNRKGSPNPKWENLRGTLANMERTKAIRFGGTSFPGSLPKLLYVYVSIF